MKRTELTAPLIEEEKKPSSCCFPFFKSKKDVLAEQAEQKEIRKLEEKYRAALKKASRKKRNSQALPSAFKPDFFCSEAELTARTEAKADERREQSKATNDAMRVKYNIK